MKRELKVTLSPKETNELVVKVLAEREKVAADYKCDCTMTPDGELVILFTWPKGKD